MLVDGNYFGSLKTVTSNLTFDLGKIGQYGRTVETHQKFALIWQTFRETHVLNSGGRFVPATRANTPANKLALYEFAHYVAEARPAIAINSIEKCNRCSGKRMRTGLTPAGAVGEVPCEDCNAYGSIAKQENFALIISGELPPRPKLEELIKEGLVASAPPTPVAPPVPPKPFIEQNKPKMVAAIPPPARPPEKSLIP